MQPAKFRSRRALIDRPTPQLTHRGPDIVFLIELFDHDAQSSVDSCVCDDIEEGVAAFEDFISR